MCRIHFASFLHRYGLILESGIYVAFKAIVQSLGFGDSPRELQRVKSDLLQGYRREHAQILVNYYKTRNIVYNSLELK